MDQLSRVNRGVLTLMSTPRLRWYGHMLSRITMRLDRDIVTTGLSYDPVSKRPLLLFGKEFLEYLSDGAILYLLLHELEHWIGFHPFRFHEGSYDPFLANVAADRIINSNIEEMGLDSLLISPSPERWIVEDMIDKHPSKIFFEEMYEAEVKAYQADPREHDKTKEALNFNYSPGQGLGPAIDNHDSWGDFAKANPETLKESLLADFEAAHKAVGFTPRRVQSLIADLKPKVKSPAYRSLRNWAGASSKFKRKFTWSKPHRYLPNTPGSVKIKNNSYGFVFDTSSSIDASEYADFVQEALSLSKKRRSYYVQVDCEVQDDIQPFTPRLIQREGITRSGGGGSDMNPALELLMKDKRVEQVIIFTDGHIRPITTSVTKPVAFVISEKGARLPESKSYSQFCMA